MKNKIFRILSLIPLVCLSINAQPLVKTFPVSSGENLQLSIDPGNINIETWSKNEVRIEVISKKKYEIENLIAVKTGNTVKFFLELDDGWNNSITVKVKSPSKFNFNLETTGGNININDNIVGVLKAETDGGNVNFNNVNGKVNVSTSGGNISGEDVKGNVKLHTNGGNISLGNIVSGRAEVDTYGGNISIRTVSSDLSAKTHGGNISVGDVGGKAETFTYGGHISMDRVSGSASMETYGGHLNLNGASGDVVAKTMGGHINLEDITGSIVAYTNGGHVTAELSPKGNVNSSLETSGGNIKLKIPASAKATIEVLVENDDVEYGDEEDFIKSDFSAATFKVDKEEGELRATYILNGGGAKISLKCISGRVSIKKWNK